MAGRKMTDPIKREYAVRSKLPEIIRQREIELGRRIAIKEIADQTGLNRNTVSSWLSPIPFGRVDSHAVITLRRWANCSWEDLLEEVELSL